MGESLLRRFTSHIPPRQFLRYLLVGAFNTLFGYSVFAVLNFLLHRAGVPASYIFAYAFSTLINITVAWLNYKLFVFHTRGDYLREWLKAMAVYWSAFFPGIVLLPVVVRILNWTLPPHLHAFHHVLARRDLAPYIASAILMAFGVIYSFLGHRNLTFRAALAEKSDPAN
jgi:putative flippase GtrA